MKTLDQLILISTQDNRVCPKPKYWIKLSEAIGKNKPNDELTPLILNGWVFSDDEAKQERFLKQVKYAFTQSESVQNKFIEILLSMDEDSWHHFKADKN